MTTRPQALPFAELSWEAFEQLCLRLAATEADVVEHRLYGVRGDDQAGIDLYARLADGGYATYQCKKVKEFTPRKIKEAVALFRGDAWYDRSQRFVLCTSESLGSKLRTDALETARKTLGTVGLIAWDADALSGRLKSHPLIVDDFFGRPWVEAFNGADAATTLRSTLDAAETAAEAAFEAARRAFLDRYGEAYGAPAFLDRERNRLRMLRSTLPTQNPITAEDLDPTGFDNAPDVPLSAVAVAVDAFNQAVAATASRALSRDVAAQATLQAAEQASATSAEGLAVGQQTLDVLLARDEVSGALREALERQLVTVQPLVSGGHLEEAAERLSAWTEETHTLARGAGPVLRELLHAHVLALQIERGTVLARSGDVRGARREFDALGDSAAVPDHLAFKAARLAYNVQDADVLRALALRLAEGSDERQQADLWVASRSDDPETVLTALDAFGSDDATRAHTRARALTALGREYAQAASLLDRAWAAASAPSERLGVAITTADLFETIVDQETDPPGVDRAALVHAATERLGAALSDDAPRLLRAHAHLAASRWFAFLDDQERHQAAVNAFEALGLSADDRSQFVVDSELDDGVLNQHVRAGDVHPSVRDWARSLRFRSTGQALREEAALRDVLDAAPADLLREIAAERLVTLQIHAQDEAAANGVLEMFDSDDAFRPLLAARITGAFRGEAAGRLALEAVVEARPRCRPALRALLLLTVPAAVSAVGEARTRLIREAERLSSRLHDLVPARTGRVQLADLYARLGRLRDALAIYDDLAATPDRTAGLLRGRAGVLVQAERLPEAAQDMDEAYALDPVDVAVGSEAGRLWIEAARPEQAIVSLEQVVADYPNVAVPHANLGLARLMSSDESQRRSALDAFETALRLDPDLDLHPMVLYDAATAASDSAAARRALQRLEGATHVHVVTLEDAQEMERIVGVEGVVQGQFDTRDSLRTFLEHQTQRSDRLNNLAMSDMAPFGALASRPWSTWLASAKAFQRGHVAHSPDASLVRAPWPSEAMLHIGDHGDDHPVGPASGLLVDLTALLTLASVGSLGETLRSVQRAYGRLVLYPGALADLREEIRSLSSGLGWQDRQSAESIAALVERHRLGPHVSDPSPADLAALVPPDAAAALGNATMDVGLALYAQSGFVSEASSYDTGEERTWGGHTWSSAEVLRALREGNYLGRTQAEAFALTAPRAFGGWDAAEVRPLEDLVLSGFVVADWHAAGLLQLWVEHGDRWPALRIGPFGASHLRQQVAEHDERRDMLAALRLALETLDALVAEGAVDALPAPDDPDEAEDDAMPYLWHYAVRLLDAASEYDLHIWADDRALGFLLWRYDMPVVDAAIHAATQHIRGRYPATRLVSTEMVLEAFTDLPAERTGELGWALFETGLRPLLGRLALRHLLAEYGHAFSGPPFDRFFEAIGNLPAFLSPEALLQPARRDAYLNIAAVPVVDALLDVAWNDAGLDTHERTTLGDAVLDACWTFIADLAPSVIGLSVARLLLSMGWRREQTGADEPDAERWLGDAVSSRLDAPRLHAVARAVEDIAIQSYRGLHDRAEREFGDADDPDRLLMNNRMSAALAWERLIPLFASDLRQAHAPVVRRLLSLLAGAPKAGQARLTVHRESGPPLSVEEDEIERAALGVFPSAQSHTASRELIGLTRIRGVWNRVVPEADRAPEGDADTHPVEIDVPYLTLALRDDEHLREVVAASLAHGLDLVDPILHERVRDLHDGLVSGDAEERARAVEQLADAAVGSVALDLERDLAHTADRLRNRSMEDLNAWLFNPRRPTSPFDDADVMEFSDGVRAPFGSLAGGLIFSLKPLFLDWAFVKPAAALRQIAERGDASLDDVATMLAERTVSSPSSFKSLYWLVTLLYLARDAPEARVTLGTVPVPIQEWTQQLVSDMLRGDRDSPSLRHPCRADAHAYALRLGIHACSAPHVLDTLHEQDSDALAGKWTTNVLVAAERLGGFAADRYPDPLVTAFHLGQACAQLQFALDKPGQTFDRLNPMLFGPALVNHERWLLLHVLDVSWDDLADGDVPPWWSDKVRGALEWLADHPEPHEDLLIVQDAQNGLGSTVDLPPSGLARRLADRVS